MSDAAAEESELVNEKTVSNTSFVSTIQSEKSPFVQINARVHPRFKGQRCNIYHHKAFTGRNV